MAGLPRHMSVDAFRRAGYATIDWIADYYERIESLPVQPEIEPGAIYSRLPDKPPIEGELFEDILADLDSTILPGLMHWQSPNFFGYFPANASAPSILGDVVSSGIGVQGMLWQTSPACTELESRVLDWLVEMLDLPGKFKISSGRGGGVIHDTASSATLCALLAARERASGYMAREHGTEKGLVAYCSEEAHSSVEKAMSIAGLGSQKLRKVPTDQRLAMSPSLLAEAIERDHSAQLKPFFVCGTVGTTSSLAIDPIEEVGHICARHKLWLHVDAAMLGTAALCPEFRYVHSGLDFADSYCFNPHKWMLTNFDCDCFYIADREPLNRALSVMPEYLRNEVTEKGTAVDYRDWQIPLGRRFRALKLWFVIRSYGVVGLQAFIRQHVAWAKKFESWIDDHPAFELVTPRSLNLLCFRTRGSNDDNRELLRRLNQSGQVFLTHAVIGGVYCLRLCIAQTNTEFRHIERVWKLIRKVADQ